MFRRRRLLHELVDQMSMMRAEIRSLTKAVNTAIEMILQSQTPTSTDLTEMEKQMADVAAALAALAAEVEEQKSVIEGATVMIGDLVQKVNDAAAAASEEGDQATADKLNELAAALDANTQKLAVALASNTDAADEVHAASM